MSLSKVFYGVATCIVFLILCLNFFHPISLDITNSDLGRHLLLGKIITTSGNVPTVNLFSYTNPTYPFINTHWLSEVFFYLCQSIFGFNGLLILSVLLITVTFGLIFVTASKKTNIFAPIIIGLLYIQVLSERTEIRPELFSFLFLALFITILYKYREKYTKWIFALVPLELLWTNFHIYFFVGIAVLTLFLVDVFISQKASFHSRKFLTLLGVTLASCFVTILNPNLLSGATYPLFVLNNYGFPVQENLNFFSAINFYKDPAFLYFGISVVLLWLSVLLAIKKMTPVDIFLSVFFTFMGIFAVRDFPLFVFGTFIPLTKAISYLAPKILRKFTLSKETILLLKVSIFVLVCVLLTPIIMQNINNHGLGFGVTDNAKDAVQFLMKANLKGPIYNNFDIGNYLEYQLYPKEKVFVDGRPEAYPKEFFQNIYFPMQESTKIFNQQSDRYHFSIIFFNHTDFSQGVDKLLYQLVRNNSWKMVYLNNSIVIFIKNIPANQAIIAKYHINENNVEISSIDRNDKNSVRKLANFFRTVDWSRPQLNMYFRYLDFDPNNCSALQNAAYILQKQNSSNAQAYINKYTQICLPQ